MCRTAKYAKKIAVGNWKMNGTRSSLSEVAEIAQAVQKLGYADALLCLPAPLIALATDFGLPLGGQDCSPHPHGAFTGDQSALQLADVGAEAVIIGHSERRTLHGETDILVSEKAKAIWLAGLTAIVCIGETDDERERGRTLDVLTQQLERSLPDGASVKNTIVAYEPVWAIGTGQTATLLDIERAHDQIRQQLQNRFATGSQMSILYGGSLKSENAAHIFAVPNVDGGLVGGASLKADDFIPIMKALGVASEVTA